MDDAKRRAIEQWTADPIGAHHSEGTPGTLDYFERLLAASAEHAPWMHVALDIAGSAGLDVLDVGCGQGVDLAQYARVGAHPTGVDLTPRHVELANAHLLALGLEGRALEGDAERLPLPDESFDRVSSNGVLHHTPDLDAALREIHRVLRPGGEARVIVYNRNSFHYWLAQVLWLGLIRGWLVRERSMERVLSRGVEHSSIGARPLVRVYSPRAMRRRLRDAGFTHVSTEVPEVELDPLGPGQRRTPVDLGPAGDPGLDVEAVQLALVVGIDLVAEGRTRADDRHLAPDDVPELRQLVDREPAEQAAGSRDPRIAAIDCEACALRLGSDHHRPELEQLEVCAVLADPRLPVEHRASICELDRERTGCEERTREREPDARDRHVEGPVHRVPSGGAQVAGTPRRR